MKHYERELFVSRVRSGVYFVEHEGIKLKIVTPTIEEELEMAEGYNKAYEDALAEDFMTEDQTLEWMRSRGLWGDEDEERIEGLKKDMEKLKVGIYENRNKEDFREHTRKYIREAEKQLAKQTEKKHSFSSNTCEGVAMLEKSFDFIKICTYYGGEKYDFKGLSVEFILHLFHDKILSEKQTREIARNDPWRSIWMLRDSNSYKLFANNGTELSVDQKNLLVWSRMYDNIQESMECPDDDVIEDDDLLDGWFIVQRKKRDAEKAESDFDNSTKSDKIKGSQEIFMVPSSNKEAEKIEALNDINAKMLKKQRIAMTKERGEVKASEFNDAQLDLRLKSNQMFKDKFRS